MEIPDVLTPLTDHVGKFIHDQRSRAQLSLRALADKAGISNPYLSQIERGLRMPSADVLAQIAKGLSLSAETLLVKAGVLEQETERSAVIDAISNDPVLTAAQQRALIEIYTACVMSNGRDPDTASLANPPKETL